MICVDRHVSYLLKNANNFFIKENCKYRFNKIKMQIYLLSISFFFSFPFPLCILCLFLKNSLLETLFWYAILDKLKKECQNTVMKIPLLEG